MIRREFQSGGSFTEEDSKESFLGLGKGRKKFLTKLAWTLAGLSVVIGAGLWAGGKIGSGVKGLTSLS